MLGGASFSDTIYARATAAGRAGVAVIRISGVDALKALAALGFEGQPTPRKAQYHRFTYEGNGVDDGLILYFPAPHSFTGEEVVELQLHGSHAVLKEVEKILAALPHYRLANAGEFSQRAFINGKMDLVQAEGLAALIEAETRFQLQSAMRLSEGYLSQSFARLSDLLRQPIALNEALIDFPDEEIPPSAMQASDEAVQQVRDYIHDLLENALPMERVSEGFNVVIIGRPNSGKSSMLNQFAKREAAIVSDIAGTTRDVIRISCDIGGYPVNLIDTAGIHQTLDAIEQKGIEKAHSEMAAADVILSLRAMDDPSQDEIEGVNSLKAGHSPLRISIVTKFDLAEKESKAYETTLHYSIYDALSHEKLAEKIRSHLERMAGAGDGLTLNDRHRLQLISTQSYLKKASESQNFESKAAYLVQANKSLAGIIGLFDVEEILGDIFSQFCIGK